METSNTNEYNNKPKNLIGLKIVGYSLSTLSLVLSVAANLIVVYQTYGFYLHACSVPRGTGARPMGLAAFYFLAGIVSFGIILPLSVISENVCKRSGNVKGSNMAKGAAILSSLPLPLGIILFCLVIALSGIRLSE